MKKANIIKKNISIYMKKINKQQIMNFKNGKMTNNREKKLIRQIHSKKSNTEQFLYYKLLS